MRYLSLCSGIEAASVAWGPLGWERALGNAMCVNVMRWLGERIAAAEAEMDAEKS